MQRSGNELRNEPSPRVNPPMRKRAIRLSVWGLFLALLCVAFTTAQADDLEGYRLAPDDQINVTVFDEPDLSLQRVRIAPNGTISMPLIGQVKVAGLTAMEAEKKITELLKNGYLKKPAVTVSVAEYRLFYVNGEVRKPGGYGYRDGLTVHKAISLAGGFSERAARNKISITHEGSKKPVKGVKLTDPVRPGDVITVQESFF